MAVTTAMNVINMAADGDTIDMSIEICAIRAEETAGATARVRLRQTNSSGVILWDSGVMAANGVSDSQAKLKGAGIIYLEVVSGAARVQLFSK